MGLKLGRRGSGAASASAVAGRRRSWVLPVWPPRSGPGYLATGLVAAAAVVTVATLLGYVFTRAVPPEPLSGVYLLGVVVIAIGWGAWLGVVTAVASALAFDFFHFPPTGSIGVYYSGQWIVIPLFLLMALLVGTLAHLARSRASEAEARRREAHQAATSARELSAEHAALHRVATVTAQETSPEEVFAAICGEVGGLLATRYTVLGRFEPDATVTVVGACSEGTRPERMPTVGSRWPLMPNTLVDAVWREGQAQRADHIHLDQPAVTLPSSPDIRSALGCPIVVEGGVWGVLLCRFAAPEPQPEGTDTRVMQFTRLLATAIANAEHRSALAEARARTVAAVDDTRRHIERDLHDGIQQGLYALALQLNAAQTTQPEPPQLTQHLTAIDQLLAGLIQDLRQISRGLRPTLLTHGGLSPVLRNLADRSPVPVEVDIQLDRRLPERIETTAYYIASEALTNVAKHAHASTACIELNTHGQNLRLGIRDNGIGGADPDRGSGLIGLRARVDALDGHVQISSPIGRGTSILVTLPTCETLTSATTASGSNRLGHQGFPNEGGGKAPDARTVTGLSARRTVTSVRARTSTRGADSQAAAPRATRGRVRPPRGVWPSRSLGGA